MRNLPVKISPPRMSPWVLLVFLAGALGYTGPTWAASSQSLVEQLFLTAKEYRRSERFDEAIAELQKLLHLDPTHELARRELNELESFQRSQREQMMEVAIIDAARAKAAGSFSPLVNQRTPPASPVSPRAAPHDVIELPPRHAPPAAPVLPESRHEFLRAPDPLVNKVRWWYVFGRSGRPHDGAVPETLEFFIVVPRAVGASVRLRVLDADTRGREDEQDGMWDTSTLFRVVGTGLREERMVGPEEPDGTIIEFGPYPVEQGEPQGSYVVFRVEVQGLEGNDNNLFAFKVSPPEAQVFAYNPAFRLASDAQTWMRFFPMVPEGTRRLVEANFDLDPDGGRISVIPAYRDGRAARSIRITPSENGEWATTDVMVPPETDGTQWTYRVIKATQRRGNMAFRLRDARGRLLPVAVMPQDRHQ